MAQGITAKELKKKYLEFFKSKEHAVIPSAPIIPEHDPTVLFTTAGMQPIVPFLMGQAHPLGKRLVDVQKCIRTVDIDEVGDSYHHTLFEMLGNWSLGDYFKKEAIEFTFKFFKDVLEISQERLAVTCFKGNDVAPKDEESADVWRSLGVPEDRIAFLVEDNWWELGGDEGPCGPSTEIFYWTDNDKPAPAVFDPEDNTWVELGNDVLMGYEKVNGKYQKAKKNNVDFGGGVERITAALNGYEDNYFIDVFQPIIKKVEELSKKEYKGNEKSMRVIADHMKAATFILGDERGVAPSNVDQGYILRRIIRRSIRHLRSLGLDLSSIDATVEIAKVVIDIYKDEYPILEQKKDFILTELKKEEDRFQITLDKGLREFEKMVAKDNQITSKEAFLLFQSFGFPIEMIQELAQEKGVSVDSEGFKKEYGKHQELSRVGAEQKFKGGLSEASEVTAKLHTATHLLGAAIRKVLGSKDIVQKGSNINPERLRYDFNFDRKLTDDEKQAIEAEINRVIDAAMPITKEEMTPDEAIAKGAQAEFGTKYPDKVSVYSIGDYSIDICMGPHANNTKDLGHFKIKKEESSAAGIRRIKAILD